MENNQEGQRDLSQWVFHQDIPRPPPGTRNYLPWGKKGKQIHFFQGHQGLEDLPRQHRRAVLTAARTGLAGVRRKSQRQKLQVTQREIDKHNRRFTHNSFGRIQTFIEYIYMRWGSRALQPRWRRRTMSAAIQEAREVASITSMRAAWDIVFRYREGRLRDPRVVPRTRRRCRLDQHRDYLMETVRRWRGLNLEERVEILKEHTKCRLHYRGPKDPDCDHCLAAVDVQPITLGRWYRKNGVSYATPGYRIGGLYNEEWMLKLQVEFVLKLWHLKDQDAEILFVDEATCDAWADNKRKTWMKKGEQDKLNLVADTKRGTPRGRVHLVGALSSKQRQWIYKVSGAEETHNEESFLGFIEDQLLDFPIQKDKAVVVLDLATQHGCARAMQTLLLAGISVLFLPPSSSNLNPIEKLWSILKANISKRRARYCASDLRQIINYNLRTETEEIFEEMANGAPGQKRIDGNELSKGVEKYMKMVLEGVPV